MSALAIEPMRADHVPGVFKIECELFTAPWSEEMFRQEVAHNPDFARPFVAIGESGELIGYMINWFLGHEVHLLNIGITPAHQRKGYARQMMDFLLDVSKREGRHQIFLEVRESNHAARRLYDSMGFQRIDVRKRYYEDSHEDAIVMILRVKTPEGD